MVEATASIAISLANDELFEAGLLMLHGPSQHGVDRFEGVGLALDLDSSSFNEEANDASVDIRQWSRRGIRCGRGNVWLKLLASIAEDL